MAWREGVPRIWGGLAVTAAMAAAMVFASLVFFANEEKAQAKAIEQSRIERAAQAQARAQARAQKQKARDAKWAERDRQREERAKQWEREAKAQRAAMAELVNNPPPKKKRRKVRRFVWESPSQTRGRLWNVPNAEGNEATLTAFLRVCMAEASGNTQDCVGIWQVVKNNRSRSCNRGYIRRITECVEGGGETLLSSLRRHQRHALGYIKARNKRAVWIRNLTTDCETPPKGFHGTDNQWEGNYQGRCSQIVADGRHLLKGELPPPRPGHRVKWLKGRPITWGGRCETGRASCDDRMACERGLARIPDTDTLNAFWCVPGAPGCRADPEPICLALGYQYEQVKRKGRVLWRPIDPGSPRYKASAQGRLVKGDSTDGKNGRNHPGRSENPGSSPSADMERQRDDLQKQEGNDQAGSQT